LGRFLLLDNRPRETWWRYTITNRSFKKIQVLYFSLFLH
jgi:hypothetical protein